MQRKEIIRLVAQEINDPLEAFRIGRSISLHLDEMVACTQQMVLTINTLPPSDRHDALEFFKISNDLHEAITLISQDYFTTSGIHLEMCLKTALDVLEQTFFLQPSKNLISKHSFKLHLIMDPEEAVSQYLVANTTAQLYYHAFMRHSLVVTMLFFLVRRMARAFVRVVMICENLDDELVRKICQCVAIPFEIVNKTSKTIAHFKS